MKEVSEKQKQNQESLERQSHWLGGAVQDSNVLVTSNREYSKLGCVSYIFMNFAILYFTHGSPHSFPVFVQNNSCNPVSNALLELNLSAWTIYRSVVYFDTTNLQLSLDFAHVSSSANIMSLQLLIIPPQFSSCTVSIATNNLKPVKLHTVSLDLVKNPGEILTFISSAISLS